MHVPDIIECFSLIDQYEMLPNIRNHSILVAKIAEQIIDNLRQGGHKQKNLPPRELVIAGALLHDIAKTPCIYEECDHAAYGAEIAERHGYSEIAEIISEHVILSNHDTSRHLQGHFEAREIVYYADKRVVHEDIVDLEARLDYIIKIYGKDDPRLHQLIRNNFAQCQLLEEHLFNFLSFGPEELSKQVLNNLKSDIVATMNLNQQACP